MGSFATVLKLEHNFVLTFLSAVPHFLITAYTYSLNDTKRVSYHCFAFSID
jgi:hypothetical protein